MSTEHVTAEITTLDELKSYLGKETSIGDWFLITQEMVDKFADATGDHQFIHVDPERAKQTFFGGTIAHGFFTLSATGMFSRDAKGIRVRLAGTKMNVNYGLDRVRFISPVPVGKRVRVRRKLVGIEEAPDKRWVQIKNETTVEVEGSDRLAMVAETLTRAYF